MISAEFLREAGPAIEPEATEERRSIGETVARWKDAGVRSLLKMRGNG